MADATYQTILEQALALSAADRARLIGDLAASLRELFDSSPDKPMALIGDELRDIAAHLSEYPGEMPGEDPRVT